MESDRGKESEVYSYPTRAVGLPVGLRVKSTNQLIIVSSRSCRLTGISRFWVQQTP